MKKPHPATPVPGHKNFLNAVEAARVLLQTHGFLNPVDDKKVRKRVKAWLDKYGVTYHEKPLDKVENKPA